ncbi:hypothetical protein [Halobacillus seohaensis]|uniref:Uncharacterized protein n=1 Tax=Halobacillus seohaensis TaxID=447421 RepID=A0ABW2ERI4_9BACI
MNETTENKKRYLKGVISPINIGLITFRNPYIAMWWAAAFPGLPHISMCKYLTGSILILWEFFVNVNANFNLAIVYSFIGEFDKAAEILDTRWILVYIPVYIYGIWDSRRLVLSTNKFSILADSYGSVDLMSPTNVAWFDHNLLDKMRPGLAAFWSFILPGLGHLYIQRLPTAFYVMIWIVITFYFSNMLPAIHFTVLGKFEEATSVVNPQWLLFFPSMYGFAIFDSYLFCKKSNELYKEQQSRYLEKNFQPKGSRTRLLLKRVGNMNIVASFASSIYVELAINELIENGISQDNIYAIPLKDQPKKRNIDAISGEGFNLFEVTISTATAFTVLGTIYGFIWYGGPVIWGLIGFFAGAVVGLIIDIIIERKEVIKKIKRGEGGEVVLMINCTEENAKMVKDILFNHFTLGVSETLRE